MPCADPDRQRAYLRVYMAERRATRRQVAIAYLGAVCAKCGGTDRLEFHHIDSGLKVDNVTRLWTRRADVVWAELEKCELLCHGCHFVVTNYGDEKGCHV